MHSIQKSNLVDPLKILPLNRTFLKDFYTGRLAAGKPKGLIFPFRAMTFKDHFCKPKLLKLYFPSRTYAMIYMQRAFL